ncbi:MAG: hypothetical protein Q4B65_01580 [Candidatus Saccharibacteria bacterium]|nr:hypothetical protein [Candidatus Saccharibacteria bacterium]
MDDKKYNPAEKLHGEENAAKKYAGAASKDARKTRGERAEGAASDLAAAESGAAGDIERADDSLAGARANESKAGGFYSGAGMAAGLKAGKDKGKGKGKGGFFKKKGPIATFLALALGAMGFVGGSQLFQPFSLLENFRETFNSMQTAVDMRSSRFRKLQMDSDRTKNPLRAKLFGGQKFKITKKQASKLSAQGIEVDEDFDVGGKKMTVLKFDDGTGQMKIIAADEKAVTKIKNAGIADLDMNNVMTFQAAYDGNSDFYYGYNKGSKTWKGAISGWFNSVTAKFLANNKLTRNLFRNWQQEVSKAEAGNTKTVAAAQEMMAKKAEGGETEGGFEQKSKDAVEGETEGEGTIKTDADTEGTNKVGKVKSVAEAEAQLKSISAKYGKVSGAVSATVNYSCLVLNVVGGVSLLVSASEALQIITLVTSYFEAIDKVKAGQGDDSPINELAGTLNETKDVKYEIVDSAGTGTEEKNKKGSAMTSSGVAALYGGGVVDSNDPSVQTFNFTSSLKRVLGGVGLSMTAFSTCTIAKISAAAIDVAMDAVEVGACIAGAIGAAFTFGATLTACGPLLASTAATVAISATAATLISAIISTITPSVAQILTRDLITNIGGEDLGNALTSGANMYMGSTHRSNGGSLGTESAYIAFAAKQQEVIANNARYERMDKSPFDVTSKYTFLGTLVNQLAAFPSVNSFMSFLTSGMSTVSSSITSLMPTSSAMDIADNLIPNYEQVCPYLGSIGAVGDAYCNPYIITDVSTMDTDPADIIEGLYDNFEDEEGDNVKIKDDSGLAEYIVMCNNRTSAFGIADQNIASSFDGTSTGNVTADGAIGAIPIIGDTLDIISNSTQLAHAGYISGESCVTGNTDGSTETPSWNEAKQYQRFIEDQSLAESMGLIEESAVTAYLDEYYEENPLDQSYEGILARYSGLEKEDVIALLDIIEYGNYIANYDPSTRYAFGQEEFEMPEEELFEENKFEEVVGMPVYAVVYSDLRNRNFVA